MRLLLVPPEEAWLCQNCKDRHRQPQHLTWVSVPRPVISPFSLLGSVDAKEVKVH